jgi:methyl-accepting chemotaxis protein
MMSIKAKFLAIILLISLIVPVLVGFMVVRYRETSRQLRILGASTADLYALRQTRSAITAQVAHSLDYFLSGHEKEMERYRKLARDAEVAFQEWEYAIERSASLHQDKSRELQRATLMRNKHNQIKETIAKAFDLMEAGERGVAYTSLETDVEDWMNYVLVEEIDWAVSEEIREVHAAYDEVLIRLGSIPWGGQKGAEVIKTARYFLSNMFMADKLSVNIQKQHKEVIDYLIAGEARELEEFKEHGLVARVALRDWTNAIRTEEEHKEKLRNLLITTTRLEQGYNRFSEMAATTFSLKEAGKAEEISRFISDTLEPFLHEVLLLQISEVIARAEKEIDIAHQRLLKVTLRTGVTGIVIQLMVSLIIIFLVIHMIRGVIIPLEKLRMGTEQLRRGALDYRIGLRTKDEMGQLALSFDRMAEDLQNTRADITIAKEYTDNILRSMSDMLVVVSADGLIRTVNDELSPYVRIDVASGNKGKWGEREGQGSESATIGGV